MRPPEYLDKAPPPETPVRYEYPTLEQVWKFQVLKVEGVRPGTFYEVQVRHLGSMAACLITLYLLLKLLRWLVFNSLGKKNATNLVSRRDDRDYDFEKDIAHLDQDKILSMDAKQLRDGLLAQEFTSRDLVCLFAHRSHTIGRQLNLTNQENFLSALKMAEYRDKELSMLKSEGEEELETKLGPLHGLPIIVKDTIYQRGKFSTFGFAYLCEYPANNDSLILQ